MAGKFGDHLGIMDVKLTYTDGKWKVVNSKAKLEKIDTKSDVADKDLIDMASSWLIMEQSTMFVRGVGETTAPITSYLLRFRMIHLFKSLIMHNYGMLKTSSWGTADENLPLSQQLHLSRQGLVEMRPTIPISQAGPLAIKNVADLYLYDNVTALLQSDWGTN